MAESNFICNIHQLVRCERRLRGYKCIFLKETAGNIKKNCTFNNELIKDHFMQKKKK